MAVSVIVQVESRRTIWMAGVLPEKILTRQDKSGSFLLLAVGVFGEGAEVCGQSMYSLKCLSWFLPGCTHGYHEEASKRIKLTLSQVNRGFIWTEYDDVPPYPAIMFPTSPPRLLPNLTGVYHCTSPGLRPSFNKYQLEVVVAPRILNFTTSPSIVFVGDPVVIKCCAKGYPQPVFTFSGRRAEALYDRLLGGVYESCATHTISTSDDIAETNITATCTVELQQRVQCSTKGDGYTKGKGIRSFPVPQEAVKICTTALHKRVSQSTTYFVKACPKNECSSCSCDVNANCTNEIGSYRCSCKAGFTGDGRTCSDIQECSQTPPLCAHPAQCIELPGSFSCASPSGSIGERCSVTLRKRISLGGLVGSVVGGSIAVFLGLVVLVTFFKRTRKRTSENDYNALPDQACERDLKVEGDS